ncbi:hypothetical protein BJY01DRAFT_212337 [Aspergillus pseudoustus]|uniref:Zn(2)-C6 fungal-type domain-containing protein n=1 Tax=Aspergillus pseudoustus TaxID=1810923 RepID=A0ABR4K699_9EURO
MEPDESGGRRQRRSGPRSKKGYLTCRGRHTRCDEARPVCGNCRKSRLKCQLPEFVSSKWGSTLTQPGMETGRAVGIEAPPERNAAGQATETHQVAEPSGKSGPFANSEVPAPVPTGSMMMTAEIAHLLRVYEKGIATWMDVFDSDLTYQRSLLCLVPSSPLLLNAICALAARQLSLTAPSPLTWTPVAEHYYGQAVHLLARLLNDYPSKMELAIVGTVLLSSYELLAFPGLDYQRHFKGTNTIINSIHAYKSESCLTRASFWIYARHEVAEALNRSSPTLQDPGLWPKFDLSEAAGAPTEDSVCNEVLRLSAETVCFVFRKLSRGQRKKGRARELSSLQDELDNWQHLCPSQWRGIQYEEEDGNIRYWFPRPNFAAGLVFYHLSMLLLCDERKKVQQGSEGVNELLDRVDAHSRQIIQIALSHIPDSAIVVIVQPLCYAARHVRDTRLRAEAILLLDNIEKRTGFHTRSKLDRQLSI